MATRQEGAPPVDWAAAAAPIAAAPAWRPQPAEPGGAGWAGAGFTRPGPAEHPGVDRELYRAALEDALAYTADRDGCGECGPQPCESHAERAARAAEYERALEAELEVGG